MQVIKSLIDLEALQPTGDMSSVMVLLYLATFRTELISCIFGLQRNWYHSSQKLTSFFPIPRLGDLCSFSWIIC